MNSFHSSKLSFELSYRSTNGEKIRMDSYKLKERPGLNKLINNLSDSNIATSITNGLRLSLASIINSHQKIVQLLTILENEDGEWETLHQKILSGENFKKWHAHFLDVSTIVDSTAIGIFKSLCALLANECETDSLTETLEDLKEGRETDYDLEYLPWGKGSLVHGLVDCTLLYIKSNPIATKLKNIFVEEVTKKKIISASNRDSLESQAKEVEEFFDQDIEFGLDRRLEVIFF